MPNSDRAASCTLDLGSMVYVFINRPETTFIDFVRFDEKSPTDKNTTKSGAVGSTVGSVSVKLEVGAGPIACVKVASANATDKLPTDIRLYFLDGKSRITEARLPNALYSTTDPATAWVVPAPDKEDPDKLSILAKDGLDPQIRLVDPTSYLTAGRTKTTELPYVVWQVKGKPAVVRYAYAAKDSSGDVEWKSETLKAQLMPKDS